MNVSPEMQKPLMETKPAISVVIPTYNRSRLLEEVIGSLWDQTLDPRQFEIIVVDNASVDNTPELMQRLQAGSPCRLLYHRLPADSGPAKARNQGVRLAQGEIIAFTDSDCRADRDWLAKGLAAFRDGVAFVTGPVLFKSEQPVRFFSRISTPVQEEHPSYPTCNAMYRREVFLNAGGFDETLNFTTLFGIAMECADTDLAWRIKEQGGTNLFLRDLVIYHEVGPPSAWNWLVYPSRLFVVAALIRRHPHLRRQLLHGGVFFFKENVLFYLAVAGLILGITVHWMFLLLSLAYPLWVAFFVLPQNLAPAKLPKLVLQILMLEARQGIICAALIYGSIRFRRLVL